jgi:hypothetical protein
MLPGTRTGTRGRYDDASSHGEERERSLFRIPTKVDLRKSISYRVKDCEPKVVPAA